MDPICICEADILTAYGQGLDPLWEGIFSGQTAIKKVGRFPTEHFGSQIAALMPESLCLPDKPLIRQWMTLLAKTSRSIPPNSDWIFASSKGEIDLFEKYMRADGKLPKDFGIRQTLNELKKIWGFEKDGIFLSSACTSSMTAIAYAAKMIGTGKRDTMMVLTADAITPFIFSGFSSLAALDPEPARPFDSERKGLSLGDSAGYMLLMKREKALKENRNILGIVQGWGCSDDANHVTGPSRDGSGLRWAIESAFHVGDIKPAQIRSIKTHGTGTVYNDSMEIKAFQSIFKHFTLPVYSIKGGTGHTLGACGLTEVLFALRSSHTGLIPPALNVKEVDPEAIGWVTQMKRQVDPGSVLCVNSGFGGTNSAVIINSEWKE